MTIDAAILGQMNDFHCSDKFSVGAGWRQICGWTPKKNNKFRQSAI
jgi:hypothetical protein